MTNKAERLVRNKEKKVSTKRKDLFAKILFLICACMSIVAVFGIIGYILYGSVAAFREIGVFKFLFGTRWDSSYGYFGILPIIVNTLIIMVCSVALGGAVGVFTAVFLVFWCPDKFHIQYKGSNRFLAWLVRVCNKVNLRTVFDQIVKLLAGIPSIVYGLFGLQVIVYLLTQLNGGMDGKGILAATILLAIMILPTVTSLTKNALEAVPEGYFEGALAMGNSKAQAVFRVVLPAAKSGIISALILALGRSVGEAMAVIWVTGNRALFPTGLFSYVRTMAVNIVLEMSYAAVGSTHQSALFATGFVLLVFVLLITLSMNLVPKEFKGKKGTKKLTRGGETENIVFVKKTTFYEVLKGIAIGCAVLVAFTLGVIIVYILSKGFGAMGEAAKAGYFSFTQAVNVPTLWPSLLATLELIVITLAISLPLGIGAAIYLNEYAKAGSKLVKVIRTFIDALSGVPSVVFGLFGLVFFVTSLNLGYNVFAGALTMVFVVLPTIIRSTEESLHAVPLTLREASYGLGAGKIRTIFKIVLPSAFPGIATAAILAIGRIIGESAALIFTVGSGFTFSGNPTATGSTLSVLLYICANEGYYMPQAYVTAFILLLLSFALNMAVYAIQRHVKKKL